jgi:phosphoglucosamine mutase
MGLFFGTDGLRGIINEDLTVTLASRVGNALSQLTDKAKILVGRDTRISGSLLTLGFAAGALKGGASVTDAGVLPTAGVAYLTRTLGFDYGVVISASHNGGEYNGIKIFDRNGYKMGDKEEEKVERRLIRDKINEYPDVGQYVQDLNLAKKYEKFLISQGTPLDGLKIVLDGSNGAAHKIAPAVFRALGASVVASSCSGDGRKINDNCGSLYPARLIARVNRYKADVGFAFDGDADRLIAVDEKGGVVDGDMVVYLLASVFKEKGLLKGNAAVGTSHTNLAIEEALSEKGIGFLRTDIGDKYVLAKLVEKDLSIGGEQSGHVILKDVSTTGDGILTAIKLAGILKERGGRFSELFDVKLYPQVNRNVVVKDKLRIINNEEFSSAVAREQTGLIGKGRLMVRASGTEPKIRVMVESPDEKENERIADLLIKLAKNCDGE